MNLSDVFTVLGCTAVVIGLGLFDVGLAIAAIGVGLLLIARSFNEVPDGS